MSIDIAKLHQALAREIIEVADFLQRELEEDNEMTRARENNHRLLQLVLEQPEMHPRDYDYILFDKYGVDNSIDVHNQLRMSNLYSADRRQRLVRIMKEISTSTTARV